MTRCGEKDGHPAWSPKGDRIAFLAKREQEGGKDEETQLYVIDAAGGEAERKTHFARGSDETLTPGWYAVLEVTDNGAGMNEQVRAQAFQPFFTTKELGHGTGLGLAMVYGYVTQLGGTARIKSEESRGTTVQLYLPTYTQAQGTIAVRSQTATPAVSPALAPPQLKAPGGRRVLVVDDEQEIGRAHV